MRRRASVSPPAVYSAVEATVAVATAVEEVVGVKVETEAASLGGTVARTG